MKEFDQNEKEELIKLIESFLEPLGCKVSNFGNPYIIKHRSKLGDNPWREYDEVIYPIFIKIGLNDEIINISSLHLNNIKSAVLTSCHEFICYNNNLSGEYKQRVLSKIYSID